MANGIDHCTAAALRRRGRRLMLAGLMLAAGTLAGGVLEAVVAPASAADDARESLRRARDYLWSQQADDGGWHSSQYAVLRSGQSLTPFVLHALLGTIDEMSSSESRRVLRAIEFIHAHVDEEGVIGRSDPEVLEYPVYSTAYALLCLKQAQRYRHLRTADNDRLIHRMESYLAHAQFDEEDGFEEIQHAYGGWGFDAAQRPGQPGHMDLAHTRRALQSLRAHHSVESAYESPLDRERIDERAQCFLWVVQKHPDAKVGEPQPPEIADPTCDEPPPYDGGFYFSPVVLDANKGRLQGGHWQSYATATCDGILALLAAGVPRDDERVNRAAEWLREHSDIEYPEGIPREHPEPWGAALRHYHYAVRAETYAALDWPGDWRPQLAAAVAARQEPDGTFRNGDSPLMKEDDPLLATALAVVALAHCRP